jgi:hypothetical protein
MQDFCFSQGNIEDHVEKIGIDVRPIIECKLEKTKLFELTNALIEEYPNLFESSVQSPNEFSLRKKFIFPGKGEADLPTLVISGRGPVFIFPRKISLLQEETTLGKSEDIIAKCLRHFQRYFGHKNIIRVGQVNEYIFDVGQRDSVKLLAERFTRINVPPNGELRIRVNRPDDDYNRIVQMEPVQKRERSPELGGFGNIVAYGIKVIVDFNNRDVSTPLKEDKIKAIIYASEIFNNTDLYKFLNCE